MPENKRLTLPEVYPVFYEYIKRPENCVGGDYHIIIDECNVKDDHVRYCLDEARQKEDKLGIVLGEMLLRLTKTQRSKLSSRMYIPCEEYGYKG